MSTRRTRTWIAVAALTATASLNISCGSDGGGGPNFSSVQDFISNIAAVGGGTVTLVPGAPPASSNGPTVTVAGGGIVINGGTSGVSLTGGASFSQVIVYVDGRDDYFRIDLPGSTTSVDLLLTIAQGLTVNNFDLAYGIGTGGVVGAYDIVPVQVIEVGSGEVQVSVSWNTPTDVDLHVVEPGGEEVYYGNPQSATNGRLDLDSNAGCNLDNKNNENITWNNAPSGSFIVRVDYYEACNVAGTTDYVVTVQRKGFTPQIFSSSFTPQDEDFGDLGSGTQITTFSW